MDAQVLRRSVTLSVAEGALATTMGSLLSGVVITGFALTLGANTLQIGILAALPMLANTAQLGGSLMLERFAQRKRLCLAALWMGRLLWLALPIAGVLAFPDDRGWLIYLLLGIVAASHALFAIGGVAWLSWIKDLVPARQRVGFLALRNLFDTFLSLAVGIGGALFLDLWRAWSPGSIHGFLVVIVAATGLGLASMLILSAIPDAGMTRRPMPPVREFFRQPLAEPNFRRLIAFYSCWNLAYHLAMPFFAVFMLGHLKLPFWHTTGLLAIGSVAGLAGNRFWARLSTRFGVKPVVMLASIGDSLFPLCWVLVEPEWSWILPVVYMFGLFSSPVAIGANNMLLKIVPDERASSYIAVFNSIVGPVTAAAAILGGAICQGLVGWSWSAGPIELGGLKIVFLLSFAGRLASLSLLHRVNEPRSKSVSEIFRLFVRARRLAARREQLSRQARPLAPWMPAGVTPVGQATDKSVIPGLQTGAMLAARAD
jgi:hypothetical protein